MSQGGVELFYKLCAFCTLESVLINRLKRDAGFAGCKVKLKGIKEMIGK